MNLEEAKAKFAVLAEQQPLKAILPILIAAMPADIIASALWSLLLFLPLRMIRRPLSRRSEDSDGMLM